MHVARHHGRRDAPRAVDGDTRPAQLAPLLVAEPDFGAGRGLLGEAGRGDATHELVAGRPGPDLVEAVELGVGHGLGPKLEAGGLARRRHGVAELLVGKGLAPDLLGRDHVLAHVLDDLVLELVIRHAHDLQVLVQVGWPVVDEPAHAVAHHHVLAGEGAELAAVEAKVARALELHTFKAQALEGVHGHGLEAGELGVEVGVAVLGEQPGPRHGAALLVVGRAPAVDGAADHLDPERRASVQVEGGVHVVEPADVEVGRTPDAREEDRALALADVPAEDREAGVGLEGVLGPAVDEPEDLSHEG